MPPAKCDNAYMIIVREQQLRTVPWKNGGGLTREIFREPPEPTPFDWRLSLATIEAPGPFSAFEGYQRTLVLVSGAGVELDFGQQGRSRLTAVGQMISFDGGWPAHCTLFDGRCTDLNLIVSKERIRSTTDCLELTHAQRVQTTQWPQTLVCCISGAIRMTNTAGRTEDLASVDVARCCPDDASVTCSPLGSAPARLFVAGLG
ncbi:MAG: HutD family protein [Sinobacteraceae bacterium]|nr:HutD family protein [Nevskiaceae bacterium]